MNISNSWAIMLVLFLLTACAKGNFPVATADKCTPVNVLRINKESRVVIDATLTSKVDTRRRKYAAQDFCAYNQPTSNGNYYLLTIYDKVGNHTSPTWMLMSKNQVFDTQLDKYEMAKDSAKTNSRISISVTRLVGLDDTSRNELIQMMKKDALDERKQ